VRFINVFSNSFLAAGFHLTHSVDIYFTNVQAWITNGNPTAGYALIIDTGVSGVQINAMSVIGGGVIIRHTLATSATFDMPPEYIFVNQMTVDTVTGMPCIELDSTLAVVDPGTRLGKSYRFEQCWASFTQTTDMPGILIAGGENVSFIQTLVRLNKYHGIHVTGGNNIRLIESAVLGNNQQNAADGDGIRIAANLINFQIIGGVSGNDIAGETGNQEYGIRIETGTSDEYIISNVDVSTGNDTGGIFDGGAGANKVVSNIIGTQDNGAGNIIAYYERKYGATGRIELGDGNFYLDYKKTAANSVTLSHDSNDYEQFDRSGNIKYLVIGGAIITQAAAGGLGIMAGPDASAALTVTSTTKGLLPPRMTSTQRDAISSPAAGLLIYNTTTGKLNVYTSTWEAVTSA
jgi:hypothetical protein